MNEIEQKEINEMARFIDDNHGFIVSSVETAEALYNAKYRNVKDKVVLSKEEYEKLKAMADINIDIVNLKSKVQEALNINPIEDIVKTEQIVRKETAKEILSQAKNKMKNVDGLIALNYAVAVINELAKQYGVEFKE